MGKLSKISFVFHPVGLAYIAAYLIDKGIEVKIFDSQVETEPVQDVIKNFKPNVIGITCVTALVYSTIEVAKLIKIEFPNIIIIVGGIHPTIRPDDFLNEPAIDYVAVGEGEITMYEFVKALESGENPALLPGLMSMKNGEKIVGPKRGMIQNLDELPPPALDLLPMGKYKVSPDVRTDDVVAGIVTSRGCPFNCIFCSNVLLTERKFRAHSIERVCSEVENLIDKYHISQLWIFDDNFAVNKKRSKEICKEFIKRGFHEKISWWAEARVDCVDEELLNLMAQANCRIISYGLESGNQRLLDLIEKNITLEQTEKTVFLTKKAGIDIRASFILGLPTETREESLKTIEFAKKLPITQVRFAIATPFPGTKLWDIAKEEGTLNFSSWKEFSMMSGYAVGSPVYAPKGRTPQELAKLQRWANMTFYLRFQIFRAYIKRISGFKGFVDITYGAMRFIWASIKPV